jgi:hypothetical protein
MDTFQKHTRYYYTTKISTTKNSYKPLHLLHSQNLLSQKFAILSGLHYNVLILPSGAQTGRSEQAGLVRMLLTSGNSPAPSNLNYHHLNQLTNTVL